MYWDDVLDAAQAQGRTINQTFLEELKQSSSESSGTTTNPQPNDTPTTFPPPLNLPRGISQRAIATKRQRSLDEQNNDDATETSGEGEATKKISGSHPLSQSGDEGGLQMELNDEKLAALNFEDTAMKSNESEDSLGENDLGIRDLGEIGVDDLVDLGGGESTGEEKVDVMTPQEVDDKLKGLVYRYKNVLPPPLLEELHEYLVSNQDLRKVFLAASMLGRYNLRDNVPKFVLKIFKDANTKVELKTGTDGQQSMYDWGQTSETYTYTMNINDHPIARKVLDYINATTNAHHNNMYIIFYFDGDHYINAHQDKDHTFVEDASFFLLNLLLKGDPRTFQFVATNKNGGKVIEAYAMVDNEGFEVTCIGNRTVKHGLKIEKSWVGFRCSLVLRTINDLIIARPAESKPVVYAGDATPDYTQMDNIAIEVSKDEGNTFTHAADLIPIRDKRAQMFLDIKRFQKAGNVVALRALLDTPHGRVQAKLEKGYKGAYYMFVCQCQGASNEAEIDAFCAAYPEAYQKKTRKEKTWPAYIEQRKTEWRSKQLQ